MQKVVRTYAKGYGGSSENLIHVLNEGYEVKFITRINEDITEYIVEKKESEEANKFGYLESAIDQYHNLFGRKVLNIEKDILIGWYRNLHSIPLISNE